jgi:hypothetical protein
MPGISTLFIADCREELEFRLKEKEQLLDQLALYDVRIDRYDAIIENMDRSLLPLINEINVAISSVKAAYDARIAAGCKSDLAWIETARVTYRLPLGRYSGSTTITQVTYTALKNPAVNTVYNRYGIKYYRRPKNQDYGSNIIAEFFGSIGAGSTRLAIRQTGLAGTAGILLGDTITDDLENPVTFGIDDLPSIVGFGVSTILIDNVGFGGTVAIGKTIIAQVGVGTTGNISVGNGIGYTGVLPYGTTVVGIGTTTIQQELFDFQAGTFISTTTTAPSLIVSQPAVATTSVVFTVGITSDFPAYFMSTTADVATDYTNFTVIRTTQSVLDEFDPSNNPVDPVTVGIMSSNTIGLGHTAILVNNGSPVGPFQWREVLGEYDPEPNCGNSSVNWYYGNTQWPTKQTIGYTTTSPWSQISVVEVPVSEGTSVTVSIGSTIPSNYNISYTSTSPTNPSLSGCSALDAAITAAESSRDAIIARNQPIITSTLAAAASLRTLRDKLEGIAFTFLQGRAASDAEIVRLRNQIASLESLDLTQYEPTSYREGTRFSGSTVGIPTT